MGNKSISKTAKGRSNYATGLKECMNPKKCICFECKAWRKENNVAKQTIKEDLRKKET
ncbi:MAG: hypothetical protein U9O94_01535 [Nanoarchaeota archaeon]|nr:hypothetical protein [Nanoarchaeota archaeon]